MYLRKNKYQALVDSYNPAAGFINDLKLPNAGNIQVFDPR